MKDKNRIVLVLIALALLFIPLASAMTVTINTPTAGKVYTHASALPLDITISSTIGDSITCIYSLDLGVTNYSVDCVDMGLDIPITNLTDETLAKPVHLRYWAENLTAIESADVDFFVYSNLTTGKSVVLVGIIMLVLVLGGFFLIYSLKLGEDLAGLKLLFMLASFVCTIVSIHLGNLAIREYLRFTPLMESYDKIYFVTITFLVVVFAYMLIMLTYKAIMSVKSGGKGR